MYCYAKASPVSVVDSNGSKAMTCERILNVAPGSAGAFHWVETLWQLRAIVPDPETYVPPHSHEAPGTAQAAGLKVKQYIEAFKCCDSQNTPVVLWGKPLLAWGYVSSGATHMYTVFSHAFQIPVPLPYGKSVTISITLALVWQSGQEITGPFNGGPLAINYSDYKRGLPDGYKYVDNIDCCFAPSYPFPGYPPKPALPPLKIKTIEIPTTVGNRD